VTDHALDSLPGLDLGRLQSHLDAAAPGLVDGPLTGSLVPGGRSNLTYLLADGARDLVLRRPPLGHVLATAHDMAREYRVMTALAGTPVPVPHTHLLCEDPDVIGAPFYVMERVQGTVYRDPARTATLGADRAHALSLALADTLADLHEVDPAAVGLADFGRPDGYLERQVRRWTKQLASSRSRDVAGIDDLAARLAARVPQSRGAAVVHGDYRLDNVLVGEDDRIAAVLDWEMATLGDPLADVGLLAVYWEGVPEMPDNVITKGVRPEFGFPPVATVLDAYAARRGADLSDLDWYVALASFKLAVILEGIHYRYTQGQTVGEGFDEVGAMVQPLVAKGLATLTGP